MALTNNPLDPDQISAQNFGTSFRGFDQDEVRRYLRQVAEAVRFERGDRTRINTEAGDQSARISALEGEIEQLRSDSKQMADELQDANERLSESDSNPQRLLPEDLDEGQLTRLLGEETVRVLDSARSAAANITAKAEKEADERTKALDKLQKETTKSLAEDRKKADKEVAALKSKAETEAKAVSKEAAAEAKRLSQEANEASEKLRSEAKADSEKVTNEAKTSSAASKKAAQEVAAAVKQRGEEVAKETRLSAEAEGESVRKAAEQVMSDAEAEAARVRAEAAADVETARDSAREEARLMLTEAQTLREKVLEDLVKRRRVARQQIDQAKAARDRLSRALIFARTQVDSATSELDVSVPEAKRAMELVKAKAGGSEADQMADIADGLDHARSKGKTLSPEKVANHKPGSGASVNQPPSSKASPGPKSTSPKLSEASKDSKASASPTADLLGDMSDDGVEAEAGDVLDDIFARIRAERTPGDSADTGSVTKVDPAPGEGSVASESEPKPEAPSDSTDNAKSTRQDNKSKQQDNKSKQNEKSAAVPAAGGAVDSVIVIKREPGSTGGSEAASGDSSSAKAGQDRSESERESDSSGQEIDIEVLAPFADRDIALTRFGPDLRRKLKRALADDQSDVLDRLRRAKTLSSDELPDSAEQLAGFRKAAEAGLVGIATAGSASLDGPKVGSSQVSTILDQLAKALQAPLRAKIERAIAAADGDSSEVFEPIRAHYRDARSSALPGLVDDAVAEAFAVGVYDAIDHAAGLVWVVDPRTETSPDCFDNTLSDSVKKPQAFPTGHKRPLGGPGCRCLVLPADQYGASD